MINHDQNDQSWSVMIIMINHDHNDQSWSIMINHDQSWSIMIILINHDQWSIMFSSVFLGFQIRRRKIPSCLRTGKSQGPLGERPGRLLQKGEGVDRNGQRTETILSHFKWDSMGSYPKTCHIKWVGILKVPKI